VIEVSSDLCERRKKQKELEKNEQSAEDIAKNLIHNLVQGGYTIKEAISISEKTTLLLKETRDKLIKEKVDEIVIPETTEDY